VIRRRIAEAWSGGGSPWLRGSLRALAPLAWLYGGAVGVRNRLYDGRALGPPLLPTISVGNLTVGGTGKTPVLRALWDRIEAAHRRCCVVTRGYGADEVALYRVWFGGDRVFTTPDRVEGLTKAAASGFDVALVDDGFQHRRAPRSLDLLLVASDAPFPPRLLPSGPYREPLTAARRADLILVTHRVGGADPERWQARMKATAPEVPVESLGLGATGWQDLDGVAASPETRHRLDADRVLAVASTADPAGFGRSLATLYPALDVELVPFPDHFQYRARDVATLLAKAGDRPIATTEKDAVKMADFPDLRGRVRVLGFGVVGGLPEALTHRLDGVIHGSRR